MYNNKHFKLVSVFLLAVIAISLPDGCAGRRQRVRLDAEDQYAKGKEKYDRAKYRDAIDLFSAMVNQNRGSDLIDDALYYLGSSYFKIDDFIMAANEFDRLLNSYPTSPLADDALYMKAVCHYEQSRNYSYDQDLTLQAISALQQYLEEFPQEDDYADALEKYNECTDRLARKEFEIAKQYFQRGHLYSSFIYFQSILTNYPNSKWVAPALYYLGECYFKRAKYDEAISYYLQALEISPEADWAGQARERIGAVKEKSSRSVSSVVTEQDSARSKAVEPQVEP